MGCGSSRPLTPAKRPETPTPRPERRKSKPRARTPSRHSRTSSTTSISSGLPGTDTSSENLSYSDEELLAEIAEEHGIDTRDMSIAEQKELLNCTFRPQTNKRSAALASRARERYRRQAGRGAGRESDPLFDRLAKRRVVAKAVEYRPTRDAAFDEYVAPGGGGRSLRDIAASKRKMLRARNRELQDLTSRLKDSATGRGPSARSSSYKSVLEKVNHLNRAIGILTAALEQAEHKLYYAFEEWYVREFNHLPPPPSPRSQAAATAIQSAYRGYRVRRVHRRPPTPYHLRPNPQTEAAAVAIQSAYRGYAARRRVADEYGYVRRGAYYDDGAYGAYSEYDDGAYGGEPVAGGYADVGPFDDDDYAYPYSDEEE